MNNNTIIIDDELSKVSGGADANAANNIRIGATYKKKSAGQLERLGYEFYARVKKLDETIVGCDYGSTKPGQETIIVKNYLSDTIESFINEFDLSREIDNSIWGD